MYQIDKEKFGAFLVQLRKEKSMTQKDLAEQLYVSDKAVSKWERGLSLPDISLLQPMAELLGVSVTELLSGRAISEDQPLTVAEVEPLVTGTLTMTVQEREDLRDHRRKWGMRFFAAILAFALEVWLFRKSALLWGDQSVFSLLPPLMALGFGVYLFFFAKEKLPAFYDQYRINFVSDGMFRMNIAGVCFNNRNWLPILNAMRTWSCVTIAGWLPCISLVCWAVTRLFPMGPAVHVVLMVFTMSSIFGGLFIPVVVAGKKYE